MINRQQYRLKPSTFFTLCLVILAAISCREQSFEQSDSQLEAISNRSQKQQAYSIVMLKLKSPALLKNPLRGEDGKLKIDPKLQKAIAEEKESILAQLKGLSDEVKVLHSYQFVLNALSLLIPSSLSEKIKEIPGVLALHQNQAFERPDYFSDSKIDIGEFGFERTSTKFIGSDLIHKGLRVQSQGHWHPVKGRGIKVGIVDTGIDYTHAMLGGSGNPLEYQNIDPSKPSDAFPNQKVVGGIDLVGSDYDESSIDFSKHIPKPNLNPLDESGHGTHVAGTVAGIGDGTSTYDGVAPEASLYAIKVFGKEGSTSDHVVIAALEYAVDPNRDGNPDDHLDVVNLSLGSSFGMPHILYDEAIANLVKADVTPVMSAGNSGNVPFIVGSPGAADDAISVAASVDNMDHNWKFRAVKFQIETEEAILVKAIEGTITKPIKNLDGPVGGSLVFAGYADDEFSDELKAKLQGKVALIDRGLVNFSDKIARALDSGAMGVVLANNKPGSPINMGGEGSFPIPGIMIRQDLGDRLKQALSAGQEVVIQFKVDEAIEEAALIDTLTSFSSRGPRSLDSIIKPEISAPGQNIVSARVGGGTKAASMSGTSMAAPHIAGAVALLKQYRQGLSESQVKSLLLSSSKIIQSAEGQDYSVAYQGAGRIRAYAALTNGLVVKPATLSLGDHGVESKKTLLKVISVENIGDQKLELNMEARTGEGIRLSFDERPLILDPLETKEVMLKIQLDAVDDKLSVAERFAHLLFKDQDGQVYGKLSALAMVKKVSRIHAESLKVYASSQDDAAGAMAVLKLKNKGTRAGEALIFNLLAKDERKNGLGPLGRVSDICDLESVGYRVYNKNLDGEEVPMLQIAVKHYSPLTSWNHCEISVQIDGNDDGIADQELLGTDARSLSRYFGRNSFESILTDTNLMRTIRAEYDEGGSGDYAPAFLDRQSFYAYQFGTVAILEARIDKLKTFKNGLLKIKVASLVSTNIIGLGDDFLANQAEKWTILDPVAEMSPFYQLPESVQLMGGESKELLFTKGYGYGRLVVYFPFNATSPVVVRKGKQSHIMKTQYAY
ncbi:MAG: S8 family serine peptidase [Oligoflexales bacterium]|nr:S8 family serine peptidase [Oligoflexales bacterium]